MRVLLFAAVALMAGCASAPDAVERGPTYGQSDSVGPNPFPVARGSALPPPAVAPSGQSAPPEGAAPGGLDFGQWRGADPAVYAPQFQTRVRQRYAGQDSARIRADLEQNGFACEDGSRLECRIEIMERQCAIDWYVVVERGAEAPVAGFDTMCLGARQG